MSEQTLNMLKKLSPKKEHSLAFRCFIGAAAIVLLTVSVHILVFTAIERQQAIKKNRKGMQDQGCHSIQRH